MKKKKFLSVALVAAMTATLLAGCGSGNSGDGGNAGNPGSGSAKGGKVHINVYRDCFNLPSPDSAQIKKVEDAFLIKKGEQLSVSSP